MTIFEVFNKIVAATATIYGDGEARAIATRLLCDKYEVEKTALILYPQRQIEFDQQDIVRLQNREPIQYIIGFTYFLDRRFAVSPAVLIPRGETQELVCRIISDLGADFDGTILDIGTGSGCIAISLALAMPKSHVSALDISHYALRVAHHNATQLGAKVLFTQVDIMNSPNLQYNIIVSNPPYVLHREKEQMERNVLEWEPAGALFVDDNDPLLYYRTIAERSQSCDRIYFEINENFAPQTRQMLIDNDFSDVEIIADIHSKDRICLAKKR